MGISNNANADREIVALGGGCFWCLEAVFSELKGIEQVKSGYSGGNISSPSYNQVCTGTTNHAEVIKIVFNPTIISFREILEVFFSVHDPTTLNKQGSDVGTQYRSIIFYHTKQQKKIVEDTIGELNASDRWEKTIATEIKPFEEFYEAEQYHQDYYKRNSDKGYCQLVIVPKLDKLRKEHQEKLQQAGRTAKSK